MIEAVSQHAKCQSLHLASRFSLSRAIRQNSRQGRHLGDPTPVFLLLNFDGQRHWATSDLSGWGRNLTRATPTKIRSAQAGCPFTACLLTLRYETIELAPPFYHRDKAAVPLWIIHVAEEDPPPGVTPVQWFLLTTIELRSPEQALRCVEWYCLRWRIEDWHRVLKSGCNIEELGHDSAERLGRAVAIYGVIAWRIMLMTLLGRTDPGLPPDVLFSDLELRVLDAYTYTQRRRDLPAPTTLKNAVWIVASMGGYLRRKSDPPPGHEVLWRGYTKLRAMAIGFSLHDAGPGP